jgi:hypothetical protein
MQEYIFRRKSRYYKLGSDIKIRDIFYIFPSGICYYIYKEPGYFITDYNIKDNIRKFIENYKKKRKNIARLLYKASLLLRKRGKTNQIGKPADLLVLIIATRLLIKVCFISILQIILN